MNFHLIHLFINVPLFFLGLMHKLSYIWPVGTHSSWLLCTFDMLSSFFEYFSFLGKKIHRYISGSWWTLTAAAQESAILKESSFLLSRNGRLSFEVDIMEVNHVLKHTSWFSKKQNQNWKYNRSHPEGNTLCLIFFFFFPGLGSRCEKWIHSNKMGWSVCKGKILITTWN